MFSIRCIDNFRGMSSPVTAISRKRGRPPGPNSRAGEGRNQSLTRALTLLERLSETPDGLNLTDLSYQLGMPPATVHRLLNTFEEFDFVEQDAEQGLWFIGLKAFTVGNAFVHRRDFVASARPYMQALMEQCGETVNLGVIDDGEAVFIGQVESREVMRMIVRLGSRSPIHASGVGKALLANLPQQRPRQREVRKIRMMGVRDPVLVIIMGTVEHQKVVDTGRIITVHHEKRDV